MKQHEQRVCHRSNRSGFNEFNDLDARTEIFVLTFHALAAYELGKSCENRKCSGRFRNAKPIEPD